MFSTCDCLNSWILWVSESDINDTWILFSSFEVRKVSFKKFRKSCLSWSLFMNSLLFVNASGVDSMESKIDVVDKFSLGDFLYSWIL